MKSFRVLSLFDGLSAARVALDRAGIKVEKYFASEIDPWAIQIAKKNYPDTVHLGDVREIDAQSLGRIDLVIGGSPCQDLSIAGKKAGLRGERSGLFFEYLRLVRELKPRYFVLENVASMKPGVRDRISMELGTEPVRINSLLVSAQNRDRLYWTNIGEIPQPVDRKIYLVDVLEHSVRKGMNPRLKSSGRLSDITGKARRLDHLPEGADHSWRLDKPQKVAHVASQGQKGRIYGLYGKSSSLVTDSTPLISDYTWFRPATPIEAERLQTLPDNYTAGVSKTQRIKMLGNAFTVDVVAHILRQIPKARSLNGPDDSVQVRQNAEHNGIEIVFPGKPSEKVRDQLKAHKFRWSGKQKLWYARHSQERMDFARSLADGKVEMEAPRKASEQTYTPRPKTGLKPFQEMFLWIAAQYLPKRYNNYMRHENIVVRTFRGPKNLALVRVEYDYDPGKRSSSTWTLSPAGSFSSYYSGDDEGLEEITISQRPHIPQKERKPHYDLSKKPKVKRNMLLKEVLNGKMMVAAAYTYDYWDGFRIPISGEKLEWEDPLADPEFAFKLIEDMHSRDAPRTGEHSISLNSYLFRYGKVSPKREAKTEYSEAERKQIAAKLREKAGALTEQIEAKRNPATAQQNPTRRRAAIMASMEMDADQMEEDQKALLALAEGWEKDSLADSLKLIRHRSQVREIRRMKLMKEPRLPRSKGTGSDGIRQEIERQLNLWARIGVKTDQQLRQLMHDFGELGSFGISEEEQQRRKLREFEREFIGKKIAGFFPTPPDLAKYVVQQADIEAGMRVLEPSAGLGHLAEAIRKAHPGAQLEVGEFNYSLKQILKLKGFALVSSEFTAYEPGPVYDRIVMNPPFENSRDAAHVRHAWKLLKPGGRLVSIMGEGVFFRKQKKDEAFREWFEDNDGVSEKLPDGSFKKSMNSTGVATRLVVMDKPHNARKKGNKGRLIDVEEASERKAKQPAGYSHGKDIPEALVQKQKKLEQAIGLAEKMAGKEAIFFRVQAAEKFIRLHLELKEQYLTPELLEEWGNFGEVFDLPAEYGHPLHEDDHFILEEAMENLKKTLPPKEDEDNPEFEGEFSLPDLPAEKKKVKPKEPESKPVIKPEAKPQEATPQPRKKRKARPYSLPEVPVHELDIELKLIRRFVNLDGKPVPFKRVMNLLRAVQRAIRKGLVRRFNDPTPHWKHIDYVQKALIRAAEAALPVDDLEKLVKLSFPASDLEGMRELVDQHGVRPGVRYVSRFLGMMGKQVPAEKAQKLLDLMERGLESGRVSKDDPHYLAVLESMSALEAYLEEGGEFVRVTGQGLMGVQSVNPNGTSGTGRRYAAAEPGDYIIPPPKGREVSFRSDQVPAERSPGYRFSGRWAELFNQPSKGFSMMVYGQPKSGKSTLVMDFAGYLARNFGTVLYASIEEGDRETILERIERMGVAHPDLVVKNNLPADLSGFDFVVVDSASRGLIELDMMRELIAAWPEVSFIFIFHVTNAGLPRGGAQFRHEVDVLVEVREGKAYAVGRFGPGEVGVRFG